MPLRPAQGASSRRASRQPPALAWCQLPAPAISLLALTQCRFYEPVRELFRTTLGQVYLARNKDTGKEVVIKMIERGPAVSKHVESELLVHRWVQTSRNGTPLHAPQAGEVQAGVCKTGGFWDKAGGMAALQLRLSVA